MATRTGDAVVSGDAWAEFMAEHAEPLGYDLGGAFIPVPNTERAHRLYRVAAEMLGRDPGELVFGWKREGTP